ncbi:hypothetical protein CPB85DRAFT_1338820 [Mucidula mucida]|nr:hypothetical protein CPB85DRAFT_1338820 [Mucidula mucida]
MSQPDLINFSTPTVQLASLQERVRSRNERAAAKTTPFQIYTPLVLDYPGSPFTVETGTGRISWTDLYGGATIDTTTMLASTQFLEGLHDGTFTDEHIAQEAMFAHSQDSPSLVLRFWRKWDEVSPDEIDVWFPTVSLLSGTVDTELALTFRPVTSIHFRLENPAVDDGSFGLLDDMTVGDIFGNGDDVLMKDAAPLLPSKPAPHHEKESTIRTNRNSDTPSKNKFKAPYPKTRPPKAPASVAGTAVTSWSSMSSKVSTAPPPAMLQAFRMRQREAADDELFLNMLVSTSKQHIKQQLYQEGKKSDRLMRKEVKEQEADIERRVNERIRERDEETKAKGKARAD